MNRSQFEISGFTKVQPTISLVVFSNFRIGGDSRFRPECVSKLHVLSESFRPIGFTDGGKTFETKTVGQIFKVIILFTFRTVMIVRSKWQDNHFFEVLEVDLEVIFLRDLGRERIDFHPAMWMAILTSIPSRGGVGEPSARISSKTISICPHMIGM